MKSATALAEGVAVTRTQNHAPIIAKVIVHIVYSTKHRKPWLNDPGLRSELHAYNATILKLGLKSAAAP